MSARHSPEAGVPLTPDDYVDVLAQTGQGLVCILDADGEIVVFDEGCERATGFAAADVVGRDAREVVIPPEEVEAFSEFMAQLSESQQPSPQIGHWLTESGGRLLIAWSNRPLLDEHGRLSGLLTVGIDLTERERASAELRELHAELQRRYDEQAALRRVATLVAGEADPEHVASVVASELARVVRADASAVVRYDGASGAKVIARTGDEPAPFPVGSTIPADAGSAIAQVLATGAAARVEPDGNTGVVAQAMRAYGYGGAEAAPITVAGAPWGAVVVVAHDADSLPKEPARALAPFADLLALAVSSAEAREQLLESRSRLVKAADEERRRLERDLHDGAQQRLVTLALILGGARRSAPDNELAEVLENAEAEAREALSELRDLARGLHPPVLSELGLQPALEGLARRAPLEVAVDPVPADRLAPTLEVATYYVVAEALTNVAKHAQAEQARVSVRVSCERLVVTVEDDGRGGANPRAGTGLRGLTDRVEALRGTLDITSSRSGTTLRAELPLA
jgi:PAS domain S-box-containing protein